jgi:osmotically-inducible protein OsmY
MTRTLLILCLLGFGIAGCSSPSGPRDPDAVLSDADIERDISQALFKDRENCPSWNRVAIRSVNGNVVLSGSVRNHQEALRIKQIAEGVSGTRTVKSKLRVGNQ